MYVIAICGPHYSRMDEFKRDLKEFLLSRDARLPITFMEDKDYLTSGEEAYGIDVPACHQSIFKEKPDGIVVVTGQYLFLAEALRKTFHVKVFVETSGDMCLSNLLRLKVLEKKTKEVEAILDFYEQKIKPENDFRVNPSSKHADIRLPETSDFKHVFELLYSSICHHMKSEEDEPDYGVSRKKGFFG